MPKIQTLDERLHATAGPVPFADSVPQRHRAAGAGDASSRRTLRNIGLRRATLRRRGRYLHRVAAICRRHQRRGCSPAMTCWQSSPASGRAVSKHWRSSSKRSRGRSSSPRDRSDDDGGSCASGRRVRDNATSEQGSSPLREGKQFQHLGLEIAGEAIATYREIAGGSYRKLQVGERGLQANHNFVPTGPEYGGRRCFGLDAGGPRG